ncbi:MAG: hypothetical protein V3R89_04480 [Thermoanaerobaculia bacterium]
MRARMIGQWVVAAGLALSLASCRATPPEPSIAQRVENPHLGLAIAALPGGFVVEANDADSFRLRRSDGEGVLWVEAGPEQVSGINLVEEVKGRRALFQEAPEGHYFGNRELMTPNGTAFTARGAYSVEDGRVEEIWVYTLHPAANRLVTLTYRYPAGGDSQQRVSELVELLGEVEALVRD